MRKLILATVAPVIVLAPIASAVKAEDTTVIRKDEPDRDKTTVIKKKEDVNVLPVPHTEEKRQSSKKITTDLLFRLQRVRPSAEALLHRRSASIG